MWLATFAPAAASVWLATFQRGGWYDDASQVCAEQAGAAHAVMSPYESYSLRAMSQTRKDQAVLWRCRFVILIMMLVSCAAASAQPLEFATRAAEELANLHEGVTVATWRRAHPTDTLVSYSHRYWDWGNWIVRAESRSCLSDGREIIRRAYFYTPDPPGSLTFPQNTRPQNLRAEAQLGFIWIETHEPNQAVGTDLAERTRAKLSDSFANGQYDLKVWFGSAAYWSKTARWNVGAATFVSAYQFIETLPDRNRMLAFGFLPISGLYVDLGGGEDFYGAAFQNELRALDAAIVASGLAEKDLTPIRLLKQKIEEGHSGNWPERKPAMGDEAVEALKQWLETARRRGRREHAAALLAADTALHLSQQVLLVNTEDEVIRRRLKAMGANFKYAHLDSYVYTHGWLKRAFRLDRGGPVGDLSLISMMEKGFNLSAACADIGYDGPRAVIFHGERFLSRSRNRKLRVQVHLLVANAYADIVALADGAGESYVEAAKYREEAPWARSMAIAHYRRLLHSLDNSQNQIKVWKAAWRLRAEVPPTHTNFFCVYD